MWTHDDYVFFITSFINIRGALSCIGQCLISNWVSIPSQNISVHMPCNSYFMRFGVIKLLLCCEQCSHILSPKVVCDYQLGLVFLFFIKKNHHLELLWKMSCMSKPKSASNLEAT